MAHGSSRKLTNVCNIFRAGNILNRENFPKHGPVRWGARGSDFVAQLVSKYLVRKA